MDKKDLPRTPRDPQVNPHDAPANPKVPDDAASREATFRMQDQENAARGNPTTGTGPNGEKIIVDDGATFDNQGNEIKR